jgi:hypothetical protein
VITDSRGKGSQRVTVSKWEGAIVNQARSSGEMLEGWQPRFTIADRDAKIKGLEVALNELRAYLANESGEVYIYPDHKLADRDSTIKGLQLESQRGIIRVNWKKPGKPLMPSKVSIQES